MMVEAKRARKAETPKQTSFNLRLRAPHFYPDRRREKAVLEGGVHANRRRVSLRQHHLRGGD
jgi:hypothetical protein